MEPGKLWNQGGLVQCVIYAFESGFRFE